MKRFVVLSLAWIFLFGNLGEVKAGTLLTYTGGTTSNPSTPGEEIMLPTAVGVTGYSNIVFNWYQGSTPTPYAVGNLYIIGPVANLVTNPTSNFDSGYSPASLSSSTFVGMAAASGNQYTFTGVTLTAGASYYFFDDTTMSLIEDGEGGTQPAGTLRFRATGTNNTGDFESAPGTSYDFTLSGTAVLAGTSVPEPATLSLAGSGGLALLGWFTVARSRRNRRASRNA